RGRHRRRPRPARRRCERHRHPGGELLPPRPRASPTPPAERDRRGRRRADERRRRRHGKRAVARRQPAYSKRPETWISPIGLVLIIVAAGFILATWKSGDRLETIEAAIVNNDAGAEVDGETVPIGRQLTSGLVGEDENNIHWVITDEDDAEAGLSDGTYAAKLTIPEGFSRAVTSVDDA